jgi:hypothetical protein
MHLLHKKKIISPTRRETFFGSCQAQKSVLIRVKRVSHHALILHNFVRQNQHRVLATDPKHKFLFSGASHPLKFQINYD